MLGSFQQKLLSVIEAVSHPLHAREVLASCSEALGRTLKPSRCVVAVCSADLVQLLPPVEWSVVEDRAPEYDSWSLRLAQILQGVSRERGGVFAVEQVVGGCLTEEGDAILAGLGIKSCMAVTTERLTNGESSSFYLTAILYQCDRVREWDSDELDFLRETTHFAAQALERAFAYEAACAAQPTRPLGDGAESPDSSLFEEQLRRSEARYRRLVEHSDAIIFHTNPDHSITYISRRALDFFGVAPEDFVANSLVYWFDLIHPDDQMRIRALADDMSRVGTGFDGEFRVVNQVTGHQRWLLARLVPVRSQEGELEGWDGFGVDITVRREAQEALIIQSKKVRALYTVSSAIRGYLDPSNIAYRGIAALCDATGADAGICYLYAGGSSGILKLVASYGFSPRFSEKTAELANLPALASYAAVHGQSVLIPDVRSDPRASRNLAEQENMRAAVVVPISVEDETLGAVGLFCQQAARFDGGDVMLVGAAANQIGLAARQANLFAAYRRQAKNLSALYRISHELSRNLSLEDIFRHAFEIVRDELGLKRLWLGLLNETNSRLVGQAAYGPGWKRRLVQVNVELAGPDNPFARAIAERRPMIIDNADEVMQEFGSKRVFSRLNISSVAVVPLVSGGMVLGVLVVQPGADDPTLNEDSIALLSSLANEIAAALLTKRLEERIAEGEKMRTAGLLAGGIAHNFNNLLQAILGQASLLEMQGGADSRVLRAAKIINDAAAKGATLVRQLLSFAHLEEASREICNVNVIIKGSQEVFQRMLRSKQRLRFKFDEDAPKTYVDAMQTVRIVSSLVSNAVEAMPEGGDIEIFTDSVTVGRGSPHYEVPFGSYVRIGVRDSGLGMDDETRRRCFEPFFTTKNVDPHTGLSMSGAGLGLAAAYALARRNGGRLVAESRVGSGSVFTLYLPVAKESQAREDLELAAPNSERAAGDRAPRLEVVRYPANREWEAGETAEEGGIGSATKIQNGNRTIRDH